MNLNSCAPVDSFESYVHSLELADRASIAPTSSYKHNPFSQCENEIFPLDSFSSFPNSTNEDFSQLFSIDSNNNSIENATLSQPTAFGSHSNPKCALVDSFMIWNDPDQISSQSALSAHNESSSIESQITNQVPTDFPSSTEYLTFEPNSSQSLNTFFQANRFVSSLNDASPTIEVENLPSTSMLSASPTMNVAKKRGLFSRSTKASSTTPDHGEFGDNANGSTLTASKLKVSPGSPSSTAGTNDTQDEDRFNGQGVMFHGKLIGHEYVAEARGEQMCQQSLKKLKIIQKALGGHKRRIVLYISFDGIKIHDALTTQQLFNHSVPQISFISRDETDTRAFGYVFGNSTTGHQFIGIKTKKEAMVVMSTIGQLFAITLKRKRSAEEAAALVAAGVATTTTGNINCSDSKSLNSEDHLYHSVHDINDAPSVTDQLSISSTRTRRTRTISSSSENVPIPALPPPISDHRRQHQTIAKAPTSAINPAPTTNSTLLNDMTIFTSFDNINGTNNVNFVSNVDPPLNKDCKTSSNRLTSSLAYDWANFDDDKIENHHSNSQSQMDDSTLNTISSISDINLSASSNTVSANRNISLNDSSTLVARSNQKNNAKNSSSTTIASSNFDGVDPFSDAFGDDPFSTCSTTADISTANIFGTSKFQRPPSASSNLKFNSESGSVPMLSNQLAQLSLEKSTSSYKSNVELGSSFNSTSSADRYAALADIHALSTSIFDSFGNKRVQNEPNTSHQKLQQPSTVNLNPSVGSFSSNQSALIQNFNVASSDSFGASGSSSARSTPNMFYSANPMAPPAAASVTTSQQSYQPTQWPNKLPQAQAGYSNFVASTTVSNTLYTNSTLMNNATLKKSSPIDTTKVKDTQCEIPLFQELDPLSKSRSTPVDKNILMNDFKKQTLSLSDSLSRETSIIGSTSSLQFSGGCQTPPNNRRSPMLTQHSLPTHSTATAVQISQLPPEVESSIREHVKLEDTSHSEKDISFEENIAISKLIETETSQDINVCITRESSPKLISALNESLPVSDMKTDMISMSNANAIIITTSPLSTISSNVNSMTSLATSVSNSVQNTPIGNKFEDVSDSDFSQQANNDDVNNSSQLTKESNFDSKQSLSMSADSDVVNVSEKIQSKVVSSDKPRPLSRQSSDVISTASSTPPAVPPRTDLQSSKFGNRFGPVPPPPSLPPTHYSQQAQPLPPPPPPPPYYTQYGPYSCPTDIYADPGHYQTPRRYNSPIRYDSAHQMNWNSTYEYLYHAESGSQAHYSRHLDNYGPLPPATHHYPAYGDFYHRQSPYSSIVYHAPPYAGGPSPEQYSAWTVPVESYYGTNPNQAPPMSGPPSSHHHALHHQMLYEKSKNSSNCSTPPPTGDLNTPPPPPPPLPNPQRRISASDRSYPSGLNRSNSSTSNHLPSLSLSSEVSRTPPVSATNPPLPNYPPPPPPPQSMPFYAQYGLPYSLVDTNHHPTCSFEFIDRESASHTKSESEIISQMESNPTPSQMNPNFVPFHSAMEPLVVKYNQQQLRRPMANYDTLPAIYSQPVSPYTQAPAPPPPPPKHYQYLPPPAIAAKHRLYSSLNEAQPPVTNNCNSISSNSSGSSGYSTMSRITPNPAFLMTSTPTCQGPFTSSPSLSSYPYNCSTPPAFFDTSTSQKLTPSAQEQWDSVDEQPPKENNIFEDNFASLVFDSSTEEVAFSNEIKKDTTQVGGEKNFTANFPNKDTNNNNNVDDGVELVDKDTSDVPVDNIPTEGIKNKNEDSGQPCSPPERNIFIQKDDPFEDDFFKN